MIYGPVAVAAGGTGLSALPVEGSVLLGGASAIGSTAPGAPGQILAVGSSGVPIFQDYNYAYPFSIVYTASGSITIPNGITGIKVSLIGGGGAGASRNTNPGAGGKG